MRQEFVVSVAAAVVAWIVIDRLKRASASSSTTSAGTLAQLETNSETWV